MAQKFDSKSKAKTSPVSKPGKTNSATDVVKGKEAPSVKSSADTKASPNKGSKETLGDKKVMRLTSRMTFSESRCNSMKILSMKFRLGMVILVAAAASLYIPLNRTLTTGGFNLSTPLDAWIPLWPVWVVPYLLCLPAWAAGLVWAAWKMDEQLFRSFSFAGLFVLLSAALFYYIFPTYVQRPVVTNNSWPAQLLQMVYQHDGAYNAFPSGHVYQTSLLCLFYNRQYPNHPWVWSSIVLVVALSTLFTHQHNLTDPLGGLAIAWVGYRFGLYIVPQTA